MDTTCIGTEVLISELYIKNEIVKSCNHDINKTMNFCLVCGIKVKIEKLIIPHKWYKPLQDVNMYSDIGIVIDPETKTKNNYAVLKGDCENGVKTPYYLTVLHVDTGDIYKINSKKVVEFEKFVKKYFNKKIYLISFNYP